MENNYKVFISFSLTEEVDKEKQKTKSFFFGQYLSNILNNLCKIKTYFCDKDLENRKQADFKKEIDSIIANTEVFFLVLFNHSDYNGKFYFAEERRKYLETHKDNRVIYLLCNNETFPTINNSPAKEIVDGEDGNHAEVYNVDDVESFEKLLRTINNYILGDNKVVDDIKICRNCFKIFHDGNDEGTICCHHSHNGADFDRFETNKLIWSCCNKEEFLTNKNEMINYAPGCIKENHHNFKN